MSVANKNRLWDRLEYVLGLIALVNIFLFINLQMIHELHDPDVWMHIKTGEYIIQHRTVPDTDIFSATRLGKEWREQTWLVKVIYYLIFHFGGADSLLFLSSLLVILAFLILFFTAYSRHRNLTLITEMFFIAVFASNTRFNVRPENFSFLFAAIYLLILTRLIRTKWLFLLPLIQLVWVNCHVYFILGPFLILIYLVSEKLKMGGVLPWGWAKIDPLDKKTYLNLVKVFLLTCLVSFINPYGYKGALNPLLINFNLMGKSNIYYQQIQELIPTWSMDYKMFFLYYVLIAVSLSGFFVNYRKINITYLVAWIIFLVVSLRVNRFTIIFNFIAFLATLDNLDKSQFLEKLRRQDIIRGKMKYLLKCGVIVFVFIYTVRTNNKIFVSQYYIYEENRSKFALLGIVADRFPVKAADFIVKNKLTGNMFNLFNDGSYLVYRLYPAEKVFIDGRTELYGGDFFKDYLKMLYLNKNVIKALFKKYDIDTVLLSGDVLYMNGLAKYFFDNSEWALVYFDINSVVFLKRTPDNKMFIDKFRVDLRHWQVPKADISRIGLKRIFPETYTRGAWMFYYLGLDEQAINEAKEALRILPNNADSYNILGRLYLKKKLYNRAFENLRLAHVYAGSNPMTLISFGTFYMETDKIDNAVNVYRKLTKLNPQFADGYYFLSEAYNKAHKTNLAIESLKKAIGINPYEPGYYRELAATFYKEAKPAEADKVYRQAASLGLDVQKDRLVDKPNPQ